MIFTWIRFASIHHPLAVLTLEAHQTSAGIVVTNALHTSAVVLAGVFPANVHILLTVRTVESVLANAFIAVYEITAVASILAGRRCTIVNELLTIFSYQKKDHMVISIHRATN